MIKLTAWTGKYSQNVFSWYESGKYSAFFRCFTNIHYPTQFIDLPQLLGQHVFELHLKNDFVGIVTVYSHDPVAKTVAAGILIDEKYQKSSVGRQANIALYTWIFNNMNVRRISVEYPSSQEHITHMIRIFWKLIDPKADEKPFESCPWYEGKKIKYVFFNGKYHDIIMTAVFKNDFERLMEIYYGKKRS